MCGIAGVFRLTHSPTIDDAEAVVRMMHAQVHRGPDDWGLLLPAALGADMGVRDVLPADGVSHVSVYDPAGPGAVLGSRRLSIIDRSHRGRMPMGTEDRRHWIVYNGETYNHRDLRMELEPQAGAFGSDTDTEVVLRGYRAWGDAVVTRLRGMFAFAVFDASSRPRLLLARDRFGIKPLYYYHDAERVVFASEVRALLRSGLVPDDLNVDALVRFLQLGSVPAPQTIVRDVYSLAPGHTLTVGPAGRTGTRYWALSDHINRRVGGAPSRRVQDVVTETRRLLRESVALHLLSDAPLGVFLSGGIDSSALVALAAPSRETPLTTVSIGFDEPRYTETEYARRVAERYRTDHREVVLRGAEVREQLPRFFAAMDQPTIDGLNTYMISRAARAVGLTVVLSGIGADELFLGYRHLRAAARLGGLVDNLRALPRGARRAILVGARAILGRSRDTGRLEYFEDPTVENVYLAARGLFGPRQIQALTGLDEHELKRVPPYGPFHEPGQDLLVAFTRLEFEHYLHNQLLRDADVMGMAHSIEIRIPYLDHLLVESAIGLPRRIRLAGPEPKALLVRALGAELPSQVWQRPKMGFAFPLGPWFRRHARELRAMSGDHKLFQRHAADEVWERFEAGRVHWSRPWALLVLANLKVARA